MKLRFYPKHGIAVRMLTERVDKMASDVIDAELALTKYNEAKEKSHVIDTDPFGVHKSGLLAHLESVRARLAAEKDLLLLLESHSAPEVLVEVEI